MGYGGPRLPYYSDYLINWRKQTQELLLLMPIIIIKEHFHQYAKICKASRPRPRENEGR